jgi:hypothetical protein
MAVINQNYGGSFRDLTVHKKLQLTKSGWQKISHFLNITYKVAVSK